MALLDLLGRRWALRVLWELGHGNASSFHDLQARCGEISSSVLSKRLRELREAEIVAVHRNGGYTLTKEGMRLLESLAPLDEWAKRWERRTSAGS
jgi:DNA-binding HxlR family transcriptional regulator